MLGIGNGITSGAALEDAFSLTSVSGLQLWLKNGGSQTLNSGNISQWNDDSGNDNHATQSTASFQPEADGGGALLDGSDDRLDLTSNIALQQFHMFFVLDLDSVNNETLFGNSSDNGQFSRLQTSTKYRHKFNSSNEVKIFDYASGKSVSTGTKVLYEFFRDSDSIEVFVDGDAFTPPSSGANDTDPSSHTVTINQLFTQQNNNSNIDGHVFEVVIFNAVLTGGDLTNVRNDINTRNGL